MNRKILPQPNDNMPVFLKYKDYYGSIQHNLKTNLFHGKLEFLSDLFVYEGATFDELQQNFVSAVESYINFCTEVTKSKQEFPSIPGDYIFGILSVKKKEEKKRHVPHKKPTQKKPLVAPLTIVDKQASKARIKKTA